MKINFKKMASVLAATVMLGSTVAFASAAWPTPFVNNGAGDAALIVGANAPTTSGDMAAALDIAAALNAQVTVTSGVISGEGDSQLISAKGTSAVTLNVTSSNLSQVWATTITDDNLPTLLADGIYQNDENSEFPYTQKINLGSNLTFAHFADSDYNDKTPSLGFKLPGGTSVLNYTLDWSTDPDSDVVSGDLADIETTDLTILGKTYYVLDADNTTLDLTLLDAAESVVISEGEETTVSVNGKDYQVSLEYVGSTTTRVNVEGMVSNSLSAGATQKLSDGAYLGVKDIMQDTRTGGISKVELSIGSGKLELLQSSKTIELNDVTEDNLKVYITRGTPSGGKEKLAKIVIAWQLDDEQFLMPDQDLVMPGFGAIKFTTTGVVFPAEEKTTVTYGSNDYIELKTTIKDGALTLPLLYATSGTGNITGIGKASDELLATSNTTSLVYNATSGVNEGFIVSWANTRDYETYYLTASVNRDSTGERTNRTTVKNKLTSAEICKDIAPSDTCTIGNVVLTASSVNYTSSSDRQVTFTINSGGSFNTLYTDKGLKVYLPYSAANASGEKGAINTTGISLGAATVGHSYDSFNLYMTEADSDGNLENGPTFYIPIDDNSDKLEAQAPVGDGSELETSSGSKVWESYMASDLATKLLSNRPGGSSQSDVEVYYHGERVSPTVYIASSSVTSGNADSIVVLEDTEASTAQGKNLIVVGGSCINTVAASLLGSTTPVCGAAWSAQTNVGAGQYLIKVFNSPYAASGKIAMLVAGYESADTSTAADYVKAGSFTDLTVGNSVVGPVNAAP